MSDLRKALIDVLDKHLPAYSPADDKPEFWIGCWAKVVGLVDNPVITSFSNGDRVEIVGWDGGAWQVRSGGIYQYLEARSLEKLPGRPLTTDDLMQVLSGYKVMVECHTCWCKSKGGVVGQIWAEEVKGIVYFAHEGNNAKFAHFKGGKIQFIDDDKGNIFVIEEET